MVKEPLHFTYVWIALYAIYFAASWFVMKKYPKLANKQGDAVMFLAFILPAIIPAIVAGIICKALGWCQILKR